MRFSVIGLVLALGILVALLAVEAQLPRKGARIGVLSSTLPRSARHFQAFEQRLRELGYVEGQTLAIEFRTAEGQAERLPALAAELVQLQVDVLVAGGPEATLRAATDATSTIPIVMVAINYDPIALGYVAGLARPGGHITGVVSQQPELNAKRLEILREALPDITRVAVALGCLFWRPVRGGGRRTGVGGPAPVARAARSAVRFRAGLRRGDAGARGRALVPELPRLLS